MNKFIIPFSVLLFIISIGCSSDNHERITGRWESVTQPMGVKGVLIFKDSTITMQRIASMNSSYQFLGNKLITTTIIPERNLNIIDTADVEFNADSLVLKRKVGEDEFKLSKLFRLDNNGSGNNIIGTWRWFDDAGNPGIIKYGKNNSVYAEMLMENIEGIFNLNDSTITMVFPGTTFHDLTYKFEKDTLFIESVDGKQLYGHLKVSDN